MAATSAVNVDCAEREKKGARVHIAEAQEESHRSMVSVDLGAGAARVTPGEEHIVITAGGQTITMKLFKGAIIDDPRETEHRVTLQQPPTAVALIMGITEMKRISIYRGTAIELVGTAVFVYFHISICRTATLTTPPEWANAVIGFCHAILLSLLIFTCGAPSGGHVNPTITVATCMTGHTSVYRALLYVCAQTAGSAAAATWMRSSLGWDGITGSDLAACTKGSLSDGRAFGAEVMFSFALLFVAYGVAFDSRQGQLFGPIVAPLLIGVTLGLLIFSAGGISPPTATSPPFTPGMNWAMCTGPAFATEFEGHEWIYVVGPIVAAGMVAVCFILVPPHHVNGIKWVAPLLEPLRKDQRV